MARKIIYPAKPIDPKHHHRDAYNLDQVFQHYRTQGLYRILTRGITLRGHGETLHQYGKILLYKDIKTRHLYVRSEADFFGSVIVGRRDDPEKEHLTRILRFTPVKIRYT